ncbi:hypothetical protein DFQ28_001676 [Apophysomyces sp. BC1034]|nr:hypothetical protein DFQ30_002089 [Apophysomyces sp. BC1015]KAG0179557.1 hypothetical protein DFQ29_001937 [Apophysomyces sp. BC1021]KAG0190708.1 hypothetical protein DFQ28_001676 [Apophysomyces sp. BC1034]
METAKVTNLTTIIVEDYRRTAKSSTEQDKDVSDPADNEIRMTQGGKITKYVDIGLTMLRDQKKTSIVVVGKGITVNKAVTVVEIIKRRMEGTLHQYTQLGSVSTVEQWDPVKEKQLDTMTVNKRIPVIIIHLSLIAMPDLEVVSGYQAPTGNDIYV